MDPTDQRTASIGLGDEAVAGVAEDCGVPPSEVWSASVDLLDLDERSVVLAREHEHG